MTPIFRLPVELLSEIFISACWVGWPLEFRKDGLCPPESFRLARVCHHWRKVALATPLLWTRFEASGTEFTKNMLLRSSGAPLQVLVKPRTWHRETALVFDHLQRIEKLGISLFSGFDDITPRRAPLLRTLTCYDLDLPRAGTSYLRLLDRIDMPSLREVEIGATDVYWTSHVFNPNLTSLCIRLRIHPAKSLRQILPVLATMPLLEKLSIDGNPDGIPDRPACMIHLPHLRYLFIQAPFHYSAVFLKHVHFPASAAMKLWAPYGTSMDAIIALIPTVVRAAAPSPSLSVYFDNNKCTLWTSSVDVRATTTQRDNCPPPALEVLLTDVGYLATARPMMALMSNVDVLKKVRTLVTCAWIEEVEDWTPLCAAMSNLAHLGLEGFIRPQLLTVIATPTPSRSREAAGPEGHFQDQSTEDVLTFLLPRLETLVIHDVDMQDEHLKNFDDGVPIRLRLLNTLRIRRAAGFALQRLIFQRCPGLNPPAVDEFRAVANEVEWDDAEG